MLTACHGLYTFFALRDSFPHAAVTEMILPSVLSENARIHARRPAVLDDDGIFTWAEFADRVARAAGMLRHLGLRRGGHFAVLMRNSFRQAELLWAGYWSGIVPVPVNWRLSPAEIAVILEDSECSLVAAEEEFLPVLDSPELSAWRKQVLRVEATCGRKAEYESLLAATAPAAVEPVHENDDAILLYTGGTTGRSKGVRLSHRNILANAGQIRMVSGFRTGDVYSHVAPMFHSADLHGTMGFLMGCSHVYLPQFTPAAAAASIERYRVTIAHWVPTMIKMFSEAADSTRHDTSSLRMLFYGSSPMPVEWVRAVCALFPRIELFHCYGLTETSPLLTILDSASLRACLESGDTSLLKSAGRPLPGVELRILDGDGRSLSPGEIGEIVVRGPNVSKGYLKRDRENAEVFRDGWFHTGDVGRLDEDGYLFLVDRKKDMIITGGENVYSSEVEAVLYRHPGVSEAAVIGVPDDRYGEALFAVIVPKAGVTLTAEEIIDHCRVHIGGYKIPRRIAFVDALPRTAVGKVQKAALRERYRVTQGGALG